MILTTQKYFFTFVKPACVNATSVTFVDKHKHCCLVFIFSEKKDEEIIDQKTANKLISRKLQTRLQTPIQTHTAVTYFS